MGETMMEGLILRFDAPLMSFGGVKVDQHNVTDRFPGLSMIAGLIANALGWVHADIEKIQQLQDRLLLASRWDINPELIVDYQTVDLDQPKMREAGWTTRGTPEHRGGGDVAKFGTHLRYRHYLSNGVLTSVVALRDNEPPDIFAIEKALDQPTRPLFIGRKSCLPSSRILVGRISGENVLDMLERIPRANRTGRTDHGAMSARWPAGLREERPEQVRQVFDMRDWSSQLHTGSRSVTEGMIKEAT
ncbi:MAG: type I-E CRISPR-associated protein Cas5/CasD [Desulfobacterales bacterium]|nr:MAG: type I-E CRISPR-associated protein Cas5/CasD [Desulfobacterales bacterium]